MAFAAAVAAWLLALLVVVLLVVFAARLVRRSRRARERRAQVTDNHDDPFRTAAGTAPAEADRPISTAVERFARMRLPARRRVRRNALLALGVVLLLAIGAGTAIAARRGPAPKPAARPSASPSCSAPRLRVAAAPEIAPVVRAAARGLDGGAGCAVEVTAEEPAVTAKARPAPDVWIPSSSAWLSIAAVDGAQYDVDGPPLAHSPIVLAAPAAMAESYSKDGRTSWAALVDGAAKHRIPAVAMPDPLRSTVGLLSVYAVNAAMAQTTPDAGIAQLRALTLRSRLKDAAADTAALLGGDADEAGAVVFPVTEQQLTEYRRGGHPAGLVGALPADGVVEADYPYAVARSGPDRDLAARLRAAIGAAALTDAGFRTDATPGALPLPDRPDRLLGPALQWSQYRTLTFQVLVMIDASGSMNASVTDRAGHTTTKAALLRESGASAAQLFGEDTSVGMWFFSTPSPSSPAHAEALPFGPLAEPVGGRSRRDALAETIAAYKPDDDAGTPLYQTVLDGEAAMRARAKDGAVTLVVVLTDGRDRQSRFSMSNEEFMSRLSAGRDPNRPVPIIAVGYGADADMGALNAMAAATGGKAVAATVPADVSSAIAQAFLAAHAPA
ncbi:substrate-binding domain-containing protein [Dactylosporangium sp. CA-092794]|uniref:substrate-binding domain-containing protein n=1 Tax=Dactylosporangium sp. CA-092794 TaxID=3239929 RepID=UPI003D8E9F82